MKSNPIRTHAVGGSGSDGTIVGFLKVQHTTFAFHSARNFPASEFAEGYKCLAALAIDPTNKAALVGLNLFMQTAQHRAECAAKGLAEAETTMMTMTHFIEKISRTIDEQVALDTAKVTTSV